MLTDAKGIKLDPRVQVVINMDGWGQPWLKYDSYRAYVEAEPVQFTGPDRLTKSLPESVQKVENQGFFDLNFLM